MQDRQQHQQEVKVFLQRHFSNGPWELRLPIGTGNETYFARCNEQNLFVKLNVHAERYQAVASIGLTPPVLAAGALGGGTSVIVQPYIPGKRPARGDYRIHLEQFASTIQRLHHSAEVKQLLPEVTSNSYSAVGLNVLADIQQRWERHRSKVPEVAAFVDESINSLRQQIMDFQGSGLVASHNDICNANWLLSTEGALYLIDLDSMSLDDPALDIGATLWWYYPPDLRREFLVRAGYGDDPAFEKRMQVRMAMHCLHILLPRAGSFDRFEAESFAEDLVDFRAVLAGEENPQGYEE